jgi:ribonuclease E
MTNEQNKQKIEKELKTLMDQDSAQVYMTGVSRFGLVELSRQRIKPSIGDNHLVACQTCKGLGFTRSIESLTNSILQTIEQYAAEPETNVLNVQLSPELCTYMINEKRSYIMKLEQRHHVDIILIANQYYHRTQSQIKRGKSGQPSSYQQIQDNESKDVEFQKTPIEGKQALVQRKTANAPHRKSWLVRFFEKLFKSEPKSQEKKPEEHQRNRNQTRSRPQQQRRRRSHHGPQQRQQKDRNTEVDNQVL